MSAALVQFALKALSCSQKALALRLGVSATQITKWKGGEYISSEMENRIRSLVNLGDKNPEFVLWAGSVDAAEKWQNLIHFLAESALDNDETGYVTEPLRDELGLLCWQTFSTLRDMGVDLPSTFPPELDIDYENYDGDDLWDLIRRNPYSSLIHAIFESLTKVYGFYAAYIEELVFDDALELAGTAADNIEPCLMDLAACKIDVQERGVVTKFREFRRRVTTEYERWLNIVKDRSFRAGVPLRAELLQLVYDSDEALRDEAERERLGFNSSRLHPDIYMDELLRGMRIIHQVLPAMMKKLGMEDFKLDESQLYLNSSDAGRPE